MKKKGKIKRFKSVGGHFLDVNIVQKRLCLKISIENCDFYLHRKLVMCSVFVFGLNIIFYSSNITSYQMAIFVGVITALIFIIYSRSVQEGNVCVIKKM